MMFVNNTCIMDSLHNITHQNPMHVAYLERPDTVQAL